MYTTNPGELGRVSIPYQAASFRPFDSPPAWLRGGDSERVWGEGRVHLLRGPYGCNPIDVPTGRRMVPWIGRVGVRTRTYLRSHVAAGDPTLSQSKQTHCRHARCVRFLSFLASSSSPWRRRLSPLERLEDLSGLALPYRQRERIDISSDEVEARVEAKPAVERSQEAGDRNDESLVVAKRVSA